MTRGRAVPLSDADLPRVSLFAADRSTRRQLAEAGHWLVSSELGPMVVSYDDAQTILRDPRWHSGSAQLAQRDEEFEAWLAERQPSILLMDGDDHQRLRRVLTPLLTPRAVERLRPAARATIDSLLDQTIDGEHDLADLVCAPFPVRVVFELLGAPGDLAEEFLDFTRTSTVAVRDRAADFETIRVVTEAFDGFNERMVATVTDLGSPGLIADLLVAERDGQLSRRELLSQTGTMLVAGTESTSAQLGCAIALFARFDEQFQLLRTDPQLVSSATEEVMRYLGAVRGTARLASEEIEYRDIIFPPGALVTLAFTVANRDRAHFDDPNTFDVGAVRQSSHLTLGHGLHFCVGAALARLELQEAIAALADRVARIELTGEIEWRPQSTDFWGPAVLPARLHPAE